MASTNSPLIKFTLPAASSSKISPKRALQSQTMSPSAFIILAIIFFGSLAAAYPHGASGDALSPSPTQIQPSSAGAAQTPGGSPVSDIERLPGKPIARNIFLNC